MNMEVTNNDAVGVVIFNPIFTDDSLTVAGAVTYLDGTLTARKVVADAVVAVADGGNTGDGTTTLATVAAGSVVPLVGAYNLEVTAAVVNGGVLKLEDPNGAIVATELTMTVGAGASTVFETAGLQFTVTDGATDFVAGDKFSLTVAADGNMVAYSRTGAGGAQNPISILAFEKVLTGAGTTPIRPLISGQVRKADLVVHGVGAVNQAEVDALRDYGIIAKNTTELSQLDNQ